MPHLPPQEDQEEEQISLLPHETSDSRPRLVKPWHLLAVAALAAVLALAYRSGPRKAPRTRGFQRLWNDRASCAVMGCDSKNFVGTCQCNDGCSYFGDCCVDYEQVCGVGGKGNAADVSPQMQGSCRDFGCGSNSRGCDGIANCNLCDCSDECGDKGTCCSDFEDYCGGGGSWVDVSPEDSWDGLGDNVGRGDEANVDQDWGGRKEHEFGPWGSNEEPYGVQGSYDHRDGRDHGTQGSYDHSDGRDHGTQGSYDHSDGRDHGTQGSYDHSDGRDHGAQGSYDHSDGRDHGTQGSYDHSDGRDHGAQGSYDHSDGRYHGAQGSYDHDGGAYVDHENDYHAPSSHGSHSEGKAHGDHRSSASGSHAKASQHQSYHGYHGKSSHKQPENPKSDSQHQDKGGTSDGTPDAASDAHAYSDYEDPGEEASETTAAPTLPAAVKPTYEASQQQVYEAGDGSRREVFEAKRHAWLDMLKWQEVSACPEQLMGKDVANGRNLESIPNVASAAVCQRLCTEKRCDACAWGSTPDQPGLSNVCFLKALDGPAEFTENPNTVASLACCRAGQADACPELVLETDVKTEESLEPRQGVTSVEECQQLCTKEPQCQVFAYGAVRDSPGLSDVCFMKSLAEGERPRISHKPGVVAGLPCACRAPVEHALWPAREVDLFTMPKAPMAVPATPGSAYCVILMRAYTYEASLLKLQYDLRQGVFACPGFDVFSNQELVIAEGLKTKKVRSSQMCQSGGEFKTALNLRIFAAFWKEIFTRKDFLQYNWLVKADADSVFVYSRLPSLLQKYDGTASSSGKGVYFNNCKYGMHGPIEVFSQNSLLALQDHFKDCYSFFRGLCSGDCNWGEDMWVDQCLKRRANSTTHRVNEYALLEEKHCDPEEGWESCSNPKKVAFHPFKSREAWQTCLQNAGA